MFSRPIFFAFVLSVVSVAAVIFVTAQPAKDDKFVAEQKRLAEELFINNLIFDARSQTTPEIAADALISIAESGKIKSQPLRRRILEEAFSLAGQAQYPVRIRYMGYAHTSTFFLYYPLELKLDKLALRSRVINALLKFDKPAARKLFLDEMPPEIDLPPVGCENAISYYDVTDYYETASAVLNETFTLKERAGPAFFYLVLPFIERMSSPSQVDLVAKMLVDLKLKPAQLSLLATSYTQALMKVRSDDFTFRIWISGHSGIKELSNALGETGTGNQSRMITAFREYVLKQLNGPRCSDGIKRNLKDPLESKYELPGYVRNLNEGVFKERPIGAGEINPENIVKATKPPYFWDSQKSSARWNGCMLLIANEDGSIVYSDEERRKPELQAALDRYLLDVGMWEAGEESSLEDFVTKKTIIFTRLLQDVVPKGRTWDALLKEYVLFLCRNELQGEGRLQWLGLVRGLMMNLLLKDLKGEERVKMIDLVKGFKNPTVNLYVDLMVLKEPDKKPPDNPQ